MMFFLSGYIREKINKHFILIYVILHYYKKYPTLCFFTTYFLDLFKATVKCCVSESTGRKESI